MNVYMEYKLHNRFNIVFHIISFVTMCLITIFWATSKYEGKFLVLWSKLQKHFLSGIKKKFRYGEGIWKPKRFISPNASLTIIAVIFFWKKLMLFIFYVPLKFFTLPLALINLNCYIPCVLFASLLLIHFPHR